MPIHSADLLRTRPDELGVYVAYVDGTPASCARASFDPGSQFAGMWGGATLPTFRKQGLYQALSPRGSKKPGDVAIAV